MIKAVIFDFDGTLANRQDYATQELRKFAHICFPDLEEDSIEMECIVQDLINWDAFGNMNKTIIAKNLKKKYKSTFDENLFREWWLEHMVEYVSLFDDTIDVLEYLKPKYKLAILTNGDSKAQWGKVNLSGVDSYMDYIIASGDIGIHKPDIRIFQHVCQRLDVKPEECIFVGDTFSTDILGAYNAGMTPIWIWNDPNRISKFPVKRIYSLIELKEIL